MSGIDVKQTENQSKKYKETALKVDQWLMLHKDENFSLDMMCKQLNITNPESRHDVTKKLAYEVGKGNVEKSNPPHPPSIYNFFQIGDVIDKIQSKLRRGIAVILIQKDPTKEIGLGGMFGEHLSSLYLAMDFNRLTVKKAKAWNNNYDPNGKIYAFKLTNKGTAFSDIREVIKCTKCHASGKIGKDNSTCTYCCGTGYSDVESQ